jgi:hypothetical protein
MSQRDKSIHTETGSSPKTLWLGRYGRSRHRVSIEFGIDDLKFSASYWYGDVNLIELEEKYGAVFMERIYFHIAAFTANTLVSLAPDTFDPGPYRRYCTTAFWKLWTAIVKGGWAQWRYEHDRPDYSGPALASSANAVTCDDQNPSPVDLQPGNVQILSFCGGGKDSLVSIKLLERSGVPFHTLVYSSSVYGPAAHQHKLCDALLTAAGVPESCRRRIWCYDDLTDSPVLNLFPEYEASSMTAAETPASVFLALPLILQHGYTYLCLGHEKSADTGNLVWNHTGEEVNHQWGKSRQAGTLLNEYIRTYLVRNCFYFSILKPIYDVLIFNMLNLDLDAVPYTHSCNLRKPWCGRCPKCAYVWINYMAYLPTHTVQNIFHEHNNLLDVPENQVSFRQMLGLEAHTPFECIGQINEVKLAFELCRRKGIKGAAMQIFEREVSPVDVPALLEHYLQIEEAPAVLPDLIRDSVINQMQAAAAQVRRNIR